MADRCALTLTESCGVFTLRADGVELANSRARQSEQALARLACARIAGQQRPRVLIGGLGLGFTLRAALDSLPSSATVIVAEISPEVVAWNRSVAGPLAHRPLADERVAVRQADVADVIAAASQRFDAIVLDVDNGPSAPSRPENGQLYRARGLAAIRRALEADGVVAVWSAYDEPAFARRLRRAGFGVAQHRLPAAASAPGLYHVVVLGTARGEPLSRPRRTDSHEAGGRVGHGARMARRPANEYDSAPHHRP